MSALIVASAAFSAGVGLALNLNRRSSCARQSRSGRELTGPKPGTAEEIANSGGSFLVAVRLDAVGRVRALNDIPVPRRYADLFTEIPEHLFRVDTSSSELRARGRAVGNS
jgi:hypothetical protein